MDRLSRAARGSIAARRRSVLGSIGAAGTGVAGCLSSDTTSTNTRADQPAIDRNQRVGQQGDSTITPNVNGIRYPDPADGLAGIDAALHDGRDVVVVLRGGATYEGDTTITMDGNPNGTGRNLTVYAHGATIEYTGSGRAVEMVKSAVTVDDPHQVNLGQTQWVGGRFEGPGTDEADSVAFAAIDTARPVIRPQQLYDWGNLVQLRNEDSFTEFPNVGGFRAIDFNTGIRFMDADTTGGANDGGGSFRGAVVDNIVANGANDRYLIEIHEGAGVYAATIHEIHSYVFDAEQVTLHLQGWLPGTKIDKFRVEAAGSDDPGSAILAENIHTPPSQVTNIATVSPIEPLVNETDWDLLGIPRPTVQAP
jgi:hypothetical protein